jgi:hypothetical protein
VPNWAYIPFWDVALLEGPKNPITAVHRHHVFHNPDNGQIKMAKKMFSAVFEYP